MHFICINKKVIKEPIRLICMALYMTRKDESWIGSVAADELIAIALWVKLAYHICWDMLLICTVSKIDLSYMLKVVDYEIDYDYVSKICLSYMWKCEIDMTCEWKPMCDIMCYKIMCDIMCYKMLW